MMGSLSHQMVEDYRENGFLAPLRVLDADAAGRVRNQLESLEARFGGTLPKDVNQKTHLLCTWMADLVRHQAILDAVESVVGPDILCWSSNFFIKNPSDGMKVTWHQDVTYWGLEPTEITTAWVALSASTPESGCMRVVPRTHLQDVAAHRDTYAEDNMLSRGQEIAVDVDEKDAVDIVLRPGEMSLHHVKIFHGSQQNVSSERRIGAVIRYIAPSVRQTIGVRDSATLVRGSDRFGHFDLEPAPSADFAEDAVAYHRSVFQRQKEILYRGTPQAPLVTGM